MRRQCSEMAACERSPAVSAAVSRLPVARASSPPIRSSISPRVSVERDAAENLALRRFALTADQAFFVDDNEANVTAARALGIRSHLFAGADALRAELNALGLLG